MLKRLTIQIRFFLVATLQLSGVLQAQDGSVGKIITCKVSKSGAEGKTVTANFKVQLYDAHTARIQVSKRNPAEAFSYALVSNAPAGFPAVVTDKGKAVEVSSSEMTVVIEKEPYFRIIIKNKKGEIVNEDMGGQPFGTAFYSSKVTTYKKLQDGERFIGMGEALGNLDRRGSGITLNNTDTYRYGDLRLSMYSSVPFYIGIHHGLVYGIFFNNSHRAFFNFGLSTPGYTSAAFDAGDADYFVFTDTSVAGILKHYTALTGRINLPPVWALGYHQSRCSYYPESQVMWVAETFRSKNIPLDCIVLDADYQHEYEPFRVNTERFPDLPGMAAKLRKMNIELTASVYPGVKIDTGYTSYREGLGKDLFIKYTDGKPFETEIAPVKCCLPDYTNPITRSWWADKMKWMEENGIRGYWNDMNEPAVAGSYLPDNLRFDMDGRSGATAEAKNLYGFQMARSSYEGALKHATGHRPFVLTRSGFAGVQRYAAVWSGDNISTDEGMLTSILLNNQLGLSGIAFCGYDLGGYIGDASRNLYKRWIQAGVFSPFCRNHREFFGAAGEPWAYGEEAEAISKTYIGFRYRLMPYIYSAFYEAAQTGLPPVRSLSIHYPFEEAVYDSRFQYQFLFGDAILVAPLTSHETEKQVYLPPGNWYDLFTDKTFSGAQITRQEYPAFKFPLFVKASAIIPVQQLVQSTKDESGDTLFLHIYHGNEKNSYTYYEDKGDGFGYQAGEYWKKEILYDPAAGELRLSAAEGHFSSRFKKIRFILHGYDGNTATIRVNDATVPVSLQTIPLLDGLEYLSKYYDAATLSALRSANTPAPQLTFVTDNTRTEITVKW